VSNDVAAVINMTMMLMLYIFLPAARGEMAMVLDLFGIEQEGEKYEVAVDTLKEWLTYERLPADWKPTKRIGLIGTFFGSRSIKKHMENIKNEQH
jgi:hypothetical protein